MLARADGNHLPAMTGGVGQDGLRRCYTHYCIGVNPPDCGLTPVSRTVGADRVAAEFVAHFATQTRRSGQSGSWPIR